MKKKPIYADISVFNEAARIDVICEAVKLGKVTGFVVEKDGKKGDRYIAQILQQVPDATITRSELKLPGQTEAVELIKVVLNHQKN